MNMKYPKIDTLWKRDLEAKGSHQGKILEGEFSRPEFENIKYWTVTEKIDGTNTRVMLRDETVIFGARELEEGDKTFWFPKNYLKYLRDTFTVDKIRKVFPEGNVTFFGEGYGGDIQRQEGTKHYSYREGSAFILFDVVVHDINQDWWLERGNVIDVARQLGIRVVPQWASKVEIKEIVEWTREPRFSSASDVLLEAEGIIARAEPMVMFRNGHDPIMFKLKRRDYRKLEQLERKKGKTLKRIKQL